METSGIDDERPSIEAVLEEFALELSAAGEFAVEDGARTSLHDLPSFDGLAGHEEEMMARLAAYFEIDLANPRVVKTYSMSGTPDTPGAGEIQVRVLATNDPQVFLGEYTYADGDIDWAVRPLKVEE